MNNAYVSSEKLWRAPQFEVESKSLGEAILGNLKQADPKKIFEVHHDSGTQVTNKEIRSKTITVAQNLLNLGVKKDDNVVFFSMLNLKITPLTFACYTIGAPVCFFETYLQEEHVPSYLEMLDPAVIIYEEKFKSMVFKGLDKLNLSNLKHIFTLDGRQQSVDEFLFKPIVDIENFQIPCIDPNFQPAILGFTSATTGLPKIIINSHNLVRQGACNQWNVGPGNIVMVLSELRWCCQVGAMLQPALLGVKRIYSSVPPQELTGDFVIDIIDSHKITHYFDVPRFIRTVFEAAERSMNPTTLSSLKFVSFGGERVAQSFKAYLSKIVPHCEIAQSYGMTEVGGEIANTEMASRNINVNGGVLRNGFMLKIMDKDQNLLGHNQIGRVCAKAPSPFLGYLKNDKANKETFIEGGWVDSGDLGMMTSDNLLDIFTRQKFTLQYSDKKILLPTDVENILYNFEDVYLCALVGNPSLENSNQDCGTLFVVPKTHIKMINFQNRLREYLRQNLTPKQLKIVKYFTIMDDLPTTTCFKIDRFALKQMTDDALEI